MADLSFLPFLQSPHSTQTPPPLPKSSVLWNPNWFQRLFLIIGVDEGLHVTNRRRASSKAQRKRHLFWVATLNLLFRLLYQVSLLGFQSLFTIFFFLRLIFFLNSLKNKYEASRRQTAEALHCVNTTYSAVILAISFWYIFTFKLITHTHSFLFCYFCGHSAEYWMKFQLQLFHKA